MNPGAGYASSNHDIFAAIVVAIEQGSSGPTPGVGIGIVCSEMYYDGGANAGPLLIPLSTSGATYNSGFITTTPQTVVDAPSIVPSQAGDFCHAGAVLGIGPLTGSVNFTWDYVFGAGTGDSNGFDNGDGMSHVLNATTGVQEFQYTSQAEVGSAWGGLAVCFKAAQ